MCFLGLFNAYSMRACLSIAITEMVYPPEDDGRGDTVCKAPHSSGPNSTEAYKKIEEGDRYHWDQLMQVKKNQTLFIYIHRYFYIKQQEYL